MPFLRSRKDRGYVSLRRRYLTVAVVVTALLAIGAVTINVYVTRATEQNTRTLQLRNSVAQTSNDVRKRVLAAELALSHMMIVPQPGEELTITDNFTQAHNLLKQLMLDPLMAGEEITAAVKQLDNHIAELHGAFEKIIEKRKDPFWVYPVLAMLTGPMLESNTEFLTAIESAVNDTSDNGLGATNMELFQKLVRVRNLWRRLIMDYRAIMIRYAGLSESEDIPQEQNIEDLFPIVQGELFSLRDYVAPRKDAILGEHVKIMLAQADTWFDSYQKLKTLRRSAAWRADLVYFDNNIRPRLESVNSGLSDLDMAVANLSARNVRSIELGAYRVNISIWLLSLLALLFIVMTYIALERLVLRPVASVAQALFAATKNSDAFLKLHKGKTREIRYLVQAFVAMHRQVRERQAALEFQALHDPLTQLPNRALVLDRIEHAIAIAKRESGQLGLLLLDLDRFKEVNDTLGHHVGDRLLEQIAVRISRLVRVTDTVARLGGDEFAVLLESTDRTQAQALAQRIVGALDKVFHVDGHSLYIGVSVGIAFYPDDGEDSETLVRHADVAMYEAKRSNQGFVTYDKEHDSHSQEKLKLVADLRAAIENDGLALHYQPKVDIGSGRVIGFEALLRWQHPQHGMIMPLETIQLAENTGLIGNITPWVLETALTEYSRLVGVRDDVHMAVNISPRTFLNPEFPVIVQGVLDATGVPASSLMLEITEGAITSDHVLGNSIIGALSSMGVGISLDDFGSGMSCLRHLKSLPVVELKIDMSFVVNMLQDQNDAAIVKSTIDLGHNMGLRVVAEGVEDLRIFHKLKELECDIAQGYFITSPMPLDELVEKVKLRVAGNPSQMRFVMS